MPIRPARSAATIPGHRRDHPADSPPLRPSVSDWRIQEAHNQAVFRQRNERIRDALTDSHAGLFVCECGDQTCLKAIELSTDEYEAVRAEATHFAIALNHENPECETVILETDRYATVALVYAPAKDLARRTNPRRVS